MYSDYLDAPSPDPDNEVEGVHLPLLFGSIPEKLSTSLRRWLLWNKQVIAQLNPHTQENLTPYHLGRTLVLGDWQG